MSKNVIVTLHSIRNVHNGSDPGNALEIFGRFDVSHNMFNPDIGEIVTLGAVTLFDHNGDNALEISQGTEFVLNTRAEFRVNEGEFLKITGHLGEQDDFGANDQLGSYEEQFSFGQLSTRPHEITDFEDDGQNCSVKMSFVVT